MANCRLWLEDEEGNKIELSGNKFTLDETEWTLGDLDVQAFLVKPEMISTSPGEIKVLFNFAFMPSQVSIFSDN